MELGMTVTRMLAEMDEQEWRDWPAFFAWRAEVHDKARHEARAQAAAEAASRGRSL